MPSRIRSIRERVAEARVALLQPGADPLGALRTLQLAADELRRLDSGTPVAEVEALRRELAHVGQLARNGEEFWLGWGRLLGLEPGYGVTGKQVMEHASTIRVEG